MKLNPLDYLFLRMETAENPAHVASLAIFERPKGYRGNFVRDLRLNMMKGDLVSKPFNLRLKPPGLLPEWYEWEVDKNLDLDFHVRHSALPKPGSMDDLMALVSRIHARQLDRARPLWECYLIEGLQGGRFATYLKMHHSIVDGAGGMEILEKGLTREPDPRHVMALWNPQPDKDADTAWPGLYRLLLSVPYTALKQALVFPQAAYALIAPSIGLKSTRAGKPFRSGQTLFNKAVSANRSFSIGSLSLEEVKATGRAIHATVNDIFLAACSGALNEYMTAIGEAPGDDFSAGVPVALARDGGNNSIAYIVVALHPSIANPIDRVIAISESAKDAKHDQAHLSRPVINTMTLMAQGTQAALGQLGLAESIPPAAGLVISNVPGLNEPRYLMGARLVGLYPMSALIHGQGLNITALSYAGNLHFGLLSTPEICPDVQRLAEMIEREFRKIKAAVSQWRAHHPTGKGARKANKKKKL